MSREIGYTDFENNEGASEINEKPDACPICGVKINPELLKAYKQTTDYTGYEYIEILYKCTNKECRRSFIAYYVCEPYAYNKNFYSLKGTGAPMFIRVKKFPTSIKKISKEFSQIYNQSLVAEKNGLNNICGPGYGKALEFLVKDYLIYLYPKNKKEIENEFLGEAIKRIKNIDIRETAEEATWLRNDESHYLRRFTDMNVGHLKDLIKLVVNFIDNKERAKKYKKKMRIKS